MSIDGTWNITVKTPMGNQEIRLALQSDGKTLTGTQSTKDESIDIQDGVVEGDEATWSAKTSKPMPMQVKFTAKVDGNDISGTAKAGFFPASPFTGHRSDA